MAVVVARDVHEVSLMSPSLERVMRVFLIAVAVTTSLNMLATEPVSAQGQLEIFGFFQNTFSHTTRLKTQFEEDAERNSFSVQQQNLFFQRDLDRRWRAFVNYEFVNSFSTGRQWGSASLEEVWIRYRAGRRLSVKLGQSIPAFNNLNQIKTRTPLLPYIIRPLVYEASFSDNIAIEEYLPQRAFIQAYGSLPRDRLKLDYAVYVGNSPNINNMPDAGQTGVDTTDSFLVGGRLGLRYDDLKAGFSVTRDHLDSPGTLTLSTGETLSLKQLTRRRLGGDLSWLFGDWYLESEGIWVTYDDDSPEVSEDKQFFYATLGYRAGERLFLFASYWHADEDFTETVSFVNGGSSVERGETGIKVPNVGASYQLRDSVILKVHLAQVQITGVIPNLSLRQDGDFYHLSTAVSVVF
jgi:hypothetical protein